MHSPNVASVDPQLQPLLEFVKESCYFEDDGIVPPYPFAFEHDVLLDCSNDMHMAPPTENQNERDDGEEQEEEDSDDLHPPKDCIEKLGMGFGVMIGITVQLSALAGNFVNVTVWGADDDNVTPYYVTITFVLWCCVMSSLFFLAFALLRYLVKMSFQLVYQMEQENNSNDNREPLLEVADIPSDSPMPTTTPSAFRSIRRGPNRCNAGAMDAPQNQHELLDNTMFHMKCHYVLGISLGISISWITTNLLLGEQRISLVYSFAPPLLGLLWFHWMKRGSIRRKVNKSNHATRSDHRQQEREDETV